MATSNTERLIFAEIQKKLFYMIPERWDAIYLYASIIEEDNKKPVGEMYFYYLPKGILKRKPVNVYEIPGLFNIDEESYNELIQKLYMDIKELRNIHRETKPNLWSNLTITIKNMQFKVEYDYEDLGDMCMFTPYERHVIWRYKNLNDYSMTSSREEKHIIERYLRSPWARDDYNRDIYVEGIYRQQVRNIIDYERTMTIEAAIAAQREEEKQAEKAEKKKRKQKNGPAQIKQPNSSNQILSARGLNNNSTNTTNNRINDEEKSHQEDLDDDFDDDMILSSDFMSKKQ